MPVQLSEEEWLSVLGLSTKWAMEGVRTLAIENLHQLRLSPHKLITFGRKYDIDNWIFIGVERLVLRKEPLGEEDVAALGVAEVLKLASIRECLAQGSMQYCLKHGRGAIPRDKNIDAKIQSSYGLQSIPGVESRSAV